MSFHSNFIFIDENTVNREKLQQFCALEPKYIHYTIEFVSVKLYSLIDKRCKRTTERGVKHTYE